MNIQPLDIVIHILNILVLYFLLRMILYKPVKAFMDKRTKAIQTDLQNADKQRADADKLKTEFEAKLASADDEVQKRLLDGTSKAGETSEAIVAQAKTQAVEILDKARKQVKDERGQMVSTLQNQISDMAISLSKEILGREVSKEDNAKVIHDFFDKAV